MVLIITQVLQLSSRWISFLSPRSYQSNSFPVSGRLSPHNLRCIPQYHIKLILSLLVSQQLHSTLLLKMPLQALLWQKLALSSPFIYFNYLSSILSFRRHSVVALINPSSCSCQDLVLFLLIHLTGVLRPVAQVLFALSSLPSLLNWGAAQICSSLSLFF